MSNEKKHILDRLFVGDWDKYALRGQYLGRALVERANENGAFFVELHPYGDACEYTPIKLGSCAQAADAETVVELLNSYMGNENCLEGFMCPECGQSASFSVAATAFFDVADNGTDDYHDVTWEKSDTCVCKACSHAGEVRDFMLLEGGTTVYVVAFETSSFGGFNWYRDKDKAQAAYDAEIADADANGKTWMFPVTVDAQYTPAQITAEIDGNLITLCAKADAAKEGN